MTSPPIMDTLCKDFDASCRYVKRLCDAGLEPERVMTEQSDAFASRIAHVEALTVTDADILVSKITKGPWQPCHVQRLVDAVNRVQKSTTSGSNRRLEQKCVRFENFMSQPEWESFRSPAFMTALIGQICDRANSLGIILPSEPTSWRMAQILCRVQQLSCPVECKDVYNRIKVAVRQRGVSRPYPHGYLEHYPDTPKELERTHPEMYRYAYAEDPPVEVYMPELDLCMHGAKMRG